MFDEIINAIGVHVVCCGLMCYLEFENIWADLSPMMDVVLKKKLSIGDKKGVKNSRQQPR